jgi:hypothetical protein
MLVTGVEPGVPFQGRYRFSRLLLSGELGAQTRGTRRERLPPDQSPALFAYLDSTLGVEGEGVDLDRVQARQWGEGCWQLVRARHSRLVHQDRDHPKLPG